MPASTTPPHNDRDTPLGAAFFGSVATPTTVKNILHQAYANSDAVTDDLVDCILKPGLEVRRLSSVCKYCCCCLHLPGALYQSLAGRLAAVTL